MASCSSQTIFFHGGANSTNGKISVKLPSNFTGTKLRLRAFSFTGIPVTGGVPNDLFYNFQLSSAFSSILRLDNGDGFPLQLTGVATYFDSSTKPILIFDQLKTANSVLEIRITTPLNDTAIFNSYAFWLESS